MFSPTFQMDKQLNSSINLMIAKMQGLTEILKYFLT